MVEGRIVDSNMDGFCSFSGNVSSAVVYDNKTGYVGCWVVVGYAVYVNWADDMTIVFFYSN